MERNIDWLYTIIGKLYADNQFIREELVASQVATQQNQEQQKRPKVPTDTK